MLHQRDYVGRAQPAKGAIMADRIRRDPAHVVVQLNPLQKAVMRLMADEVSRTAAEMAEASKGRRLHHSLERVLYLKRDANAPEPWPPRWVITPEGINAVNLLRAAERRP